MNPSRQADADVPAILQHGSVAERRLLPSFNQTYEVELVLSESQRCKAIYKPREGETPLWDFPDRTLYVREWLAYEISRTLGWGIVPPTVIREGPLGLGTMQLYVEAVRGLHYFNVMPACTQQMARIALFDCIINNCDRKAGHCLVDSTGKVWAIDHGLSLTTGRKLRTVMWDLAGEPITDGWKAEIARLSGSVQMQMTMRKMLSESEVDAFQARVKRILESSTIPIEELSDPYRPFPWPAI